MKLNMDLEILGRWFAANKLSINIAKTCSILFRSRLKYIDDNHLGIKFNGEVVEQVSQFKYLGVILDQFLDFKNHVDYIRGKVNQRTGFMWRIRTCISQKLARDLYISLIDPYFNYCAFIYDGCQLVGKRAWQISQNKALHAVLQVGNRHSSEALHAECNIE